MIFLLDQDVPDSIARVIHQAGHEAQRLRELLPIDSPDSVVLAFAQARTAVLITCNRDDFLELAKTNPHAGIIVLIRRPTRIAECSHFLCLLQAARESGLRDNINSEAGERTRCIRSARRLPTRLTGKVCSRPRVVTRLRWL